MSDDFVFPQDRWHGEPTAVREGGLTKRELFAAMIYAQTLGAFDSALEGAVAAVECADALLTELGKTP